MKVFGDYKYDKKDKIGQGAFGKVYKGQTFCKKTNSTKIVATKKVALGRPGQKLIERETSIMKRLSDPTHRNIVTLFHSQQQGDNVYFFMEYCNGGNLEDYLKSKGQLDERELSIFLRQIAAGLKVAHEMHIVHRDLKPENILLCFSGHKYPDAHNITFKIADFGIGRFLGDKEMALTDCGTQLYKAPEVHVGRAYAYKVDLWTIGVIAYECLVGLLQKRDRSFAHQDAKIPTNISDDCADFLNGLLEKDETKRFDTEKFFNHTFLDATISVTVVESGKDDTKQIQVNDGKSADHLIDIVSAHYSKDHGVVLLYHADGPLLEHGSGQSIRESGIIDKSTITLVIQLSGGNEKDGTVATYGPSYVSS